MRNRLQRRASVVYQLDPLYRQAQDGGGAAGALLRAGPPSLVDFGSLKEAEIDDVVFVSVPVTTSRQACERIKDLVSVSLSDKRLVIVLTHNIELLRARRLTAAESATVLGRIQDPQAEDLRERVAEMQAVVYQRVRNVLDDKESIDPAQAADVLNSIRDYIRRSESESDDKAHNHRH